MLPRCTQGLRRLTSQLLLQMDMVARAQAPAASSLVDDATFAATRVVVLAATNVPEAIDTAFLRSGRFSRFIHVPPPPREDRIRILVRE